MKDWIQTYTVKQFYPRNPQPDDVDIYDIAHHLSQICRFVGACEYLYSVAEHSIHVSHKVPKEYALWGLLHDAAEAYIGDIAGPTKQNMYLFKEIEQKILHVVATHFGLEWPMPQIVKDVDSRMLATERRDVMKPSDFDWGLTAEPYKQYIKVPMDSIQAEVSFLSRYDIIRKENQ